MRLEVPTLAILALAASAPMLSQDLTIVSKVTRDDQPSQSAISYLSRDHVRMAQGDGKESIVDFTTGQMTTLDPRKKTFDVLTRQDLEAMAAQMKERMNSPEMKRAQERMKNLPPEDQKRMNAGMGGMFAFDVQKTGATRKIAGYKCEVWKITFGEFSRTEECLSSEVTFPAQAWDMYKSFAESLQSMMSAMGPMGQSMEEMREKFKKMRGYPLATTTQVNVMGHSMTTVSEVTEIKRGPIAPSVWEVPAGYTQVDNPIKRLTRSPRHGG